MPGLLSLVRCAESSQRNVSILFADKTYPGPLQCSNDACRKSSPNAYLPQVGSHCKRCAGQEYNICCPTPKDKACEVARQDFTDRYYFPFAAQMDGSVSPEYPEEEEPQPATFPERMTTGDYMSRIQDFQRTARCMLVMDESTCLMYKGY